MCLHGFTDTWRTWELVLPALERQHDVLTLTLAGHAGGPPLGEVSDAVLADAVERAMDEAGFELAHVVGNSLGGYVALQLAARGRARTVVALAPAGGWAQGDESYKDTLAYFTTMQELLKTAAPHAEAIVVTPEGRRRATQFTATNFEHISATWPSAAASYRDDWLPHADWVELEGIGHCPQLDVPVETAQLILGFTTR